jgi:D-glycero-alpha-D-manno-heptose-7-phosphate kinase
MIISKTPYRISFFGGGSDYPEWYTKNGGKILSSTIDKYIYLSFRELPPYFGFKYRIVWSNVENTNHTKNIKHNVVRNLLPFMKIKKGIELHYQADLPARSGMGSSSSFIVGLLNSIMSYKKKKISKVNLANQSIFFENKVLNEIVGIQDQISASVGGFNKININKNGKYKIIKINSKKNLSNLNKNLVLVFTGINRSASEIAGKYVDKLNKSKHNQMLEITNHVDEGAKLLKSGKINDFGKLMNESWMLKKSLSNIISNKKIDQLHSFFMNNGALGGKLLGAGGGGFMLFCIPPYIQKKIFEKNKNIKIVPFKFSNTGSKIILNQND